MRQLWLWSQHYQETTTQLAREGHHETGKRARRADPYGRRKTQRARRGCSSTLGRMAPEAGNPFPGQNYTEAVFRSLAATHCRLGVSLTQEESKQLAYGTGACRAYMNGDCTRSQSLQPRRRTHTCGTTWDGGRKETGREGSATTPGTGRQGTTSRELCLGAQRRSARTTCRRGRTPGGASSCALARTAAATTTGKPTGPASVCAAGAATVVGRRATATGSGGRD